MSDLYGKPELEGVNPDNSPRIDDFYLALKGGNYEKMSQSISQLSSQEATFLYKIAPAHSRVEKALGKEGAGDEKQQNIWKELVLKAQG